MRTRNGTPQGHLISDVALGASLGIMVGGWCLHNFPRSNDYAPLEDSSWVRLQNSDYETHCKVDGSRILIFDIANYRSSISVALLENRATAKSWVMYRGNESKNHAIFAVQPPTNPGNQFTLTKESGTVLMPWYSWPSDGGVSDFIQQTEITDLFRNCDDAVTKALQNNLKEWQGVTLTNEFGSFQLVAERPLGDRPKDMPNIPINW